MWTTRSTMLRGIDIQKRFSYWSFRELLFHVLSCLRNARSKTKQKVPTRQQQRDRDTLHYTYTLCYFFINVSRPPHCMCGGLLLNFLVSVPGTPLPDSQIRFHTKPSRLVISFTSLIKNDSFLSTPNTICLYTINRVNNMRSKDCATIPSNTKRSPVTRSHPVLSLNRWSSSGPSDES